MRLLLAVDGSEFSDAAVEEVASRPWPPNTEILVLSAAEEFHYPAYDSWVMPDHYHKEMMEISRSRAERVVNKAVSVIKEAKGPDAAVTGVIIEGRAKDVILDHADEWNPDLIVVGSHGYGGLTRLLLGSVSHAVVQQAKTSVEIVRRPATTPEE